MIPRVTQLPVLPKLPHKTRPHATNFTNCLLSPLPTRLVCAHTTVCRPASILHREQSAESVEALEDWTIWILAHTMPAPKILYIVGTLVYEMITSLKHVVIE